MDDKNEREKLMEELKRINREKFEKFYETICESFDDFLKRKSLVKDDWEMKCPYENGDTHYCLQPSGDVFQDCWEGIEADNKYFSQGNTFPTEQAAKLEAKRRNLLTRFKAFRDECNGNWKVNWNKRDDKYYLYLANNCKEIVVTSISTCEAFPIFGYFKNRKDLERAIELFEDEIIELYVDNEV